MSDCCIENIDNRSGDFRDIQRVEATCRRWQRDIPYLKYCSYGRYAPSFCRKQSGNGVELLKYTGTKEDFYQEISAILSRRFYQPESRRKYLGALKRFLNWLTIPLNRINSKCVYAYSTEQTYLEWIKQYIFFHKLKYPGDMGEKEIEEFLTYLAVERNVAASTQNQALNALVFLYKKVLDIELGEKINAVRSKKPRKIPVAMTPEEVVRVIEQIPEQYQLMVKLLYGCGLRLKECLRLRVMDLEFFYKTLTVRDGKGGKDRVTMLPESLIPALDKHLKNVYSIHQQDLKDGYGKVYLPNALAVKYPNAPSEWKCEALHLDIQSSLLNIGNSLHFIFHVACPTFTGPVQITANRK